MPLQARLWRRPLQFVLASVLLSACGGGGSAGGPPEAAQSLPTGADRVAIGDRLFDDTTLSASGRLACATCHDASRGHADAPGVFLPFGGVNGDHEGLRSTPTLRYLSEARAFRFNPNGDPAGGLTWDGRADNRAAQARLPLLAAHEMANGDQAALAQRLRALPYVAQLRFAYSLPVNASDAQLVDAAAQALADYQAGDASFQPYTSKFDASLEGRATLSAQEARGLALFIDPRRGNCAVCHTSTPPPGASKPLFTNFTYHALGVPRNASHATRDSSFFDLGLCGPRRTDLRDLGALCGMFRVPTLRNVALTAPYFHNAAIATLEDAVAFYATRDSDPAHWYPVVNGQVQRFNDLPPQYHANVSFEAPFNQQVGAPPALSAQDVQDIVAFLRTLSDGYVP